MIGKEKSVQAGTLRSRFTPLTYFIQFLRKHQVFAGMSRTHLKLLEDCVNDFNKELNPFIKQKKSQFDVKRLDTVISGSFY